MRERAAVIQFVCKAFARCFGLRCAHPVFIIILAVGRVVVPAGAFDAEQNLKGTAVLDRLFAGALEHAGKIEAEGAAAKQGNVKVNLHRLVVDRRFCP